MKKLLFIVMIFCCLLFADNEKKTDPFEFSAPKDWRPERIPFPLSFAPDIKYKGFEELRFAPGMFNPKAEDYFCYVFFFWIEDKISLTPKDIEKDLLSYYKGLCKVVGEKRKLGLDIKTIKVSVAEHKPQNNDKADDKKNTIQKQKFSATVDWYDPFVTGKALTLYMDIHFFYDEAQKNSIVFACVSPNKPTKEDKTWATMYKIRDSFTLKKDTKKDMSEK